MRRRKTAKLIALLLAALMLAALCACGGKGGDQASRPTAYDGENEYEALLDYADRLEEAGNAEAAALVRARIPQAAAGEAREKIEEYMHNDEQFQMFENMEDAMEIADALKGGK